MCYNCGCFNPKDDMGSPDNIIDKTLETLSTHWKKSLDQTKKDLFELLSRDDKSLTEEPYLNELFTKAAKSWGQSVEEAKKNIMNLLKTQIK